MKLVANLTIAGLMCLVGEAFELADGFGLDQERVTACLIDSQIGPPIARKLDKISSDHYPPGIRLSLLHKDVRLVLGAAQRRDVDLPLTRAAEKWVAEAAERGLGDLDYSAVIAHIRGRTPTA
jgi:3-hydroxyisobutyrate dehydrogenase/2-hydroxy-3-oxopropionate reductase